MQATLSNGSLFSAALTQDVESVCELPLIEASPKLHKELFAIPKNLELGVANLEQDGTKRKADIEDKLRKLSDIEEDLDNFNERLDRHKYDFDKESTDPSLDPLAKKDIIENFDKVKNQKFDFMKAKNVFDITSLSLKHCNLSDTRRFDQSTRQDQ